MKPTEKEMRAIENHISKAEQVERLKVIFSPKYNETCNCCDLQYVPQVSINGGFPCPKCDADYIQLHLERHEEREAV